MIKNSFVNCNYCKIKILLRFQIGYFDIPFDFHCPNCGVSITGLQKINDRFILEVNNAKEVDARLEEIDYYGDFSVELPHKKISKFESIEEMLKSGFSPFINTVMLFDSEDKYLNLIKCMNKFFVFKNERWKKISPLYDLYFNGKIQLTKNPILELSNNYTIENDLDVIMALHQLTLIGFNALLPNDSLEKYISLAKKIVDKENIIEVGKYVSYIERKINLKKLLKKVIKVYTRWIDDFEKYVPSIILSLGKKMDVLDKTKYGIATTSFENMKAFYADSYELILEMITIAVGLNNVVVRKDFNSFFNKKDTFDFESYFNQTKYERLNLLIETEPFSTYINIDRHVRNAISHYDYEFNTTTQKIIFFDKFKNKENNVEMYLFDLATLCYENVLIIVYLNELLYSLQKISYIEQGMIPNINIFSKNNI